MVLPDHLAKLIDCDRAEYGTWTIGTTAAEFSVPQNQTLYIIGIQAQTIIGGNPIPFSELEYRFITDGKIYSYLDRLGADGNTNYDAYIKTSKDVFFNVFSMDAVGYSASIAPAPAVSKQPRPSVSLGNEATPAVSVSVVRQIQAKGVLDYVQKTYKDDPAPSAFGASVRWNEFKGVEFWPGVYPNPEELEQLAGKYPLLTVHYVLVNKNPTRT